MKSKRKRLYQDKTGLWYHTTKRVSHKEYYTEDDYIKAEYYIYNNLAEEVDREVEQVPQKVLDVLLEGEVYKSIDDISASYVITNRYRIICTKNGRVSKPFMSHGYHYCIIENKQVNFKKQYLSLGWEYEYEDVVPFYEERGWNYLDYRIKHAPRVKVQEVE